MNTEPILQMHTVSKRFKTTSGDISILENVSLTVMPGEKVAIIGPSGSGKSTLLSLIGLLDTPTSGDVTIAGKNVEKMNEKEMAKFRNEKIGFIFQSFELISPFTVLENISAPLDIGGITTPKGELAKIITDVSMTERADALPYTLSGGEKQRVAIARALIHKPALILADEPTGSLDRATGERVLKLLLDSVSEQNTTLIIITHDESIAERMDRVFEIKNKTVHERN
jgi:ABC-type lipoprotein export system ATPase subunit